jgi:hypothetical protein
MDSFDGLYQRLNQRHATEITESMRSRREGGLVGVQDDDDFRQAIAMAEQGFATLRGEGQRDGKGSVFSQTEQIARERVDELPDGWDDLFKLLVELLKGKIRRFLDGEDKAA